MAKITAEEVRAKYKDIYDYSLDFLFVSDLGGKFIDANDIALSRLGYEREEIPKLNFTDLLDEENLKKAFADTKDIIETGNQSTFGNYKIKAKNGDFIHVETYGIPLKENEKIVAILGIGREITERVIAEEKLRDSEEKYRHLIENSPFSIALVRIDGTIVHANPANEKIFGHTKEDIVGKNFLKLGIFPPETMPLMIQFFDELQKGKRVDLPEFKIFKKDGSSCYVKADISLFNIGNEAYFQVITQDVTEKRESEEKLKQSEEKYRSIMDNISDTVLQMDISGNIEYISPQVQELGDYMPDELLGTNGFNLIHEEDLEDVTRVIKEALEEKRPRRVELRLKHKDGHYVPVSARGTVLRSDTGSSDGKEDVTITCVLRDKTQQKEVEDKLKQSEWKYRHLFDDSPFSIVLLDMKGMIVDCNQKTLQMYKGDKKDFIGKSFQEIGNYPPEDIPKFTKIFMQLLKEGKPVAFENRTFNVLGETFWLKIDATMIKIDGDDYIQVISHDITESKEIANKLLESERKYRLISENVSDIIVVLDESFKFIFINEARERMTGFTIDEILEHPSGYFIHEEDRETSINFLMKVYQEGAATAEVRFKCKDGSFLWMEGKGKRFTDESGEKKLLIIYRDISERKNAEFLLKKSEERYR
ncbi:MAG: PAS domain S-box protein, partial [Candidatus Hodarchaeota archaeon]